MSAILVTALSALVQVAPAQPPVAEERDPPAAKGDMVLRWNERLLHAVREAGTPPPAAARNMAMVHVAVYDAVNAIHRTHQRYRVEARADPETSPEAAVAAAAHHVLVALYPGQKGKLDAALAASLADIPAGAPRDAGAKLGRYVAEQILEWRKGDGADREGKHTAGTGASTWRPTAPGFKAPLLPGWGKVRPFSLREGTRLVGLAPPPLGGAIYAAAFREVRELGARDSKTRTADQTEIAHYWADGAGTSTPPGHWNRIAQEVARARGLTLAENARLFALLNIGLADAAIICWWCKFDFDLWRPITAIRASDEEGDPKKPADPDWTPLLETPPFPSYTSGHSTFSGAAATVLAKFFATDRMRFESTSEGLPGVRRAFTGFWAAAEEAGQSRIYGGIHWQFDNTDGLAAGRTVGEWVSREFLRPRAPAAGPREARP